MSMLNKIEQIIDSNGHGEIHYKKWDVEFRDDYFDKVYWSYFPITKKYYFEANPSFSYEYKNLFDLARYPMTLLRDGYVGLLDLFLTHPIPNSDIKTFILIDKKFESLIPKQWKKQVACYSIGPIKEKFQKKGETVIVHGLGVEETFWKESPKSLIENIKKITKEYKKIIFLTPQRESLMSTRDNQIKKYDLALFKALHEVYGFDIEIEMQSEEYLSKFKMKEFSFYNINQSKVFVADDFIDHFFYSKGGYSLNQMNEIGEERLKYKLSRYHEISIENPSSKEGDFSKLYLPFKMSKKTDVSIYDIFQSDFYRKYFIANF